MMKSLDKPSGVDQRLDRGVASQRKNVLVLGSYLTPEHAGATHSTVTIVKALAESNWANVTVGAYGWDPSFLPAGVPVIQLREQRPPGPLWRIFPLPEYWHAFRALREHDLGAFDLCYTHSISLALAYRRQHPDVTIATHPGAVLWDREILEEGEAPARWRRLQARLARPIEAKHYRMRKCVHFVSTRLVGTIRSDSFRVPPETFKVAPLPVDSTHFDPARVQRDVRQELEISPDSFVIATVARLVPWKRVDAVLRALKAMDESAMLLVVGEGPEREPLEALAVELQVADRVRFVGRQDPRDYLAAANVFALPSLIESFGLVYVEAMLMGLPCIGLRYRPPAVLSAAMEVIPDGEAGFCVDSDDELRDRLAYFAANPDACRAMGERARRRALELYGTHQYIERLRLTAD
jgi:glycosyltransferase involved in cell wall biosynthesis